jgi:hypothetical protein
MWPAAHPRIYLERGETVSFSLRVWIEDPAGAPIRLTPGSGVEKTANGRTPGALPPNAVTTTVRTESSGSGYWLDIKAGPIDKTGVFRAPLDLPQGLVGTAGGDPAAPDVTLVVVDSSIAVSPTMVNLGAISIAGLGRGPVQSATVNVRKLFGSFKVLSVTSSIPALSFDVQTLARDKNYLIRIRVAPGSGLGPGAIDSSILIRTDDPRHGVVEIALKAVIVP